MSEQTEIVDGGGKINSRNNCASCAACEIPAGGRAICRRNPPGRSPGGGPTWPPVDPEKDWCMQWSAQP